MFEKPKFIQSSFNIVFPKQQAIRRKANEFEDRLKGQYFQPQIIPVPDDLDPEVPRMIFGSEHGYSQIIVSQVNLVLNVTYSPDWQIDISKGRQYLLERVPVLFELLGILGEENAYFCGLTTRVHLPSKEGDQAILNHLAKLFFKNTNVSNTHDIQFKVTMVLSERFYSNITVQNYRSWKLEGAQQETQRLSRRDATELGIQIVGDFNDRYAFNESTDYRSAKANVAMIVDSGLDEIKKVISKVEGVPS